MTADPQHRKCDFCERTDYCNQVAVVTAGNEFFSSSETYWICVECAARPISDLIDKGFADRDARPQFPPYPGPTTPPKQETPAK